MLRKLIELIKQAIRRMTKYTDITDLVDIDEVLISDEMSEAIQQWKLMYKNEASWIDSDVSSMGLPKSICQMLQMMVMCELTVDITPPPITQVNTETGEIEEVPVETKEDSLAEYINNLFKAQLLSKLDTNLEKAMALGGMIIKPYLVKDSIYFDFVLQGDFYPISFDDDGRIIDVAFLDQFISGSDLYTKIERHTFSDNTIVVQNKAFKAKLVDNDDMDEQELGKEIPLTAVSKWADIEPEVTIQDVEKPMYGYYRVPVANNVDMESPLGVSVFSAAADLIKLADIQFSRLDWEYEAGQIAIDVDSTALCTQDTYFKQRLDSGKDRIYRKLDLGNEDTYHAFTPSLRDTSYIQGLNTYLHKIEDACGLARGTLGDVQSDARTATEIKILRQNTYTTITKNQESLEQAFRDAIDGAKVFIELYELHKIEDFDVAINWSDSILTDVDTELAQKRLLVQDGILSKAELRAWYTGEDLDTAKQAIEEMQEESIRLSQELMFNAASEDAGGEEE